ncbi:MAG: PAS domain-containing protein, partial [Halobacteriales archaeon]
MATEDQSFGSAVVDAVEGTGVAVSAEHVEPVTGDLTRRDTESVEGAIVDGQMAEATTVVERLSEEADLPVVALCESAGDDDTVARAIEAGATDVFPRTTTNAQYELIIERFVADDASKSTRPPADEETSYRQAYEALFEKISEGLVVHDPETGAIVDVNEQFCEMNGYDCSELLGEPIGIVMTAEGAYRPEAAEEMIQRARTEGPQRFEWRNQRRDGEIFPVEVDLTVIELGGRERVLASVQDITERKRREQEYEQIFNSVQDAIAVIDLDTYEMVDVNDAFCELVGYDRETVLDLGMAGVSAGEEGYTRDRAEKIIDDVSETGEMGPFEWTLETRDGDHRVAEVIGTTAEIGGEVRYISINRDVTERRRREQEYEQIFNGVNDSITIHDPETGELLEVNDALCDLLGHDREEIIESSVMEYTPSGQGYTVEEAKEFIREVVETGEPKRTEWAVETADGEIRQLEVTGTTVEIGGDLRYVAIDRDITERKRREQEFEQIFNGVNDGITIHDPDTGEILDANETYLDIFGHEDVETLRERGIGGLSVTEEGYTEERARALINDVAVSEEPRTVEWQIETADGEQRWFESTVAPAEIAGEKRVLAIQRDVTERKRRQREFEQIFNGVQDAIVVLDPDTVEILDANEAFL